jgi:hypothetical protein
MANNPHTGVVPTPGFSNAGEETLGPVQILRLFEYFDPHGIQNPNCGVFVLGCADKFRNTVISQQRRAVKLVRAMFDPGAGRVIKGQTIGIVGGGVAGITAAITCAELGKDPLQGKKRDINILLFEKSNHLVPIFDKAGKRKLHPHIFEWPQKLCENNEAKLYLNDSQNSELPLKWRSGPAEKVGASIRDEFERYQSKNDEPIDVRKGYSIQFGSINEAGKIILHGSKDEKSQKVKEFLVDHLIIAVGFGEEECRGGPRYWEKDDFDDPKYENYFIVGHGDGGLFDCLRLCIKDFDEDWIVSFLKKWEAKKPDEKIFIEEKIQKLERQGGRNLSNSYLKTEYQALARKADWAADHMKFSLRRTLHGRNVSPTVYLFSRNEDFITNKSSPINSFLFAMLQRLQKELGKGASQPVSALRLFPNARYTKNDDGGWIITTQTKQNFLSSDYQGIKGQLVLRTGAVSALKLFSQDIWQFGADVPNENGGSRRGRFSILSELDLHQSPPVVPEAQIANATGDSPDLASGDETPTPKRSMPMPGGTAKFAPPQTRWEQADHWCKQAGWEVQRGDWENALDNYRRAMLAFQLYGVDESTTNESFLNREREASWLDRYSGRIFHCECIQTRLADRDLDEIDRYNLAVTLAIRQNESAADFLMKLHPGSNRWQKQSLAEAFLYLGQSKHLALAEKLVQENLNPEREDSPGAEMWDILTRGFIQLRQGNITDAEINLKESAQFADNYGNCFVKLMSIAGQIECFASKLVGTGTNQAKDDKICSEARLLFEKYLLAGDLFQIPFADASLAMARILNAQGQQHESLTLALRSFAVASRKSPNYCYALGVERVRHFLKTHFPGETLPKTESQLNPSLVRHHENNLKQYLERFLKASK